MQPKCKITSQAARDYAVSLSPGVLSHLGTEWYRLAEVDTEHRYFLEK